MSEPDLLSAEQIAAIKARAESPTRVTLPHDDIPRLLRHIDAQAKRIAALETRLTMYTPNFHRVD